MHSGNTKEQLQVLRTTSIGVLNESSLHSSVKQWYALPGDVLEANVDGYVVDIVRGDLLIEIQSASFSSIAEKLRHLVRKYAVLLVHPVAKEKWIVKVSASQCLAILLRRPLDAFCLLQLK